MATINAPNQQNQNFNTANTAPEQQNPAANSGVPTSSGQFSTLQKYLGANKNAGQRIAGMVGGNLEKESAQQKTTTQRELGESSLANQNFGNLTNETQGFTQQLSQPSGQQSSVNGKAYDVNSYSTNLSGQQAAKDIAADQNKLQRFTGIRTGDIGAQQHAESQKQANEAVVAASKAYDLNKQRQSQLTNNQGRDQLISNTLNTKNQRAGVRNLDNAFLTQDKTKSLNNISNNLRQDVGNLQASIDSGKMSAEQIIALKQAQQQAETGLTGRLTDMDKEYNDILNSRVGAINTAKKSRVQDYLDQYERLKRGEAVSEGFAKDLQLDRVKAADTNRPTGPGMVDNNMGMPSSELVDNNMGMSNKTPYEGVRLFNSIRDNPDLRAMLDMSTLEREALNSSDVINQQDISNLNALSALSGKTNNFNRLSDFMGRQVGESQLDDILNTRADRFRNEDLVKNFTGTGGAREDVMRQRWNGSTRTGEAVANSSATANINDFLNNQIYRQTSSGEQRDDSILGRIINNPLDALNPITGVASPIKYIGDVLKGPQGMESESAQNFRDKDNMDRINDALRTREQELARSGFNIGGLSGNDLGSRGEQERVATRAESQSVENVRRQAEQYINDIGYKNLLRLSKGDF